MALVNCNNFQIVVYLSKAPFRFAQIAQHRYNKQPGKLHELPGCFIKKDISVECMIRKGLRASNLSKLRTKIDAGDNARKPMNPLWIIHIHIVFINFLFLQNINQIHLNLLFCPRKTPSLFES